MPYEPTNWKSGDVVTSAKLNKLEAGVVNAGSVMVINYNGDTFPTFEEILTALKAGTLVMVVDDGDGEPDTGYVYYLTAAVYDAENTVYRVYFASRVGDDIMNFGLSSESKTDPMTV